MGIVAIWEPLHPNGVYVLQEDDAFLWELPKEVLQFLVVDTGDVDNIDVNAQLPSHGVTEAGFSCTRRAVQKVSPSVGYVAICEPAPSVLVKEALHICNQLLLLFLVDNDSRKQSDRSCRHLFPAIVAILIDGSLVLDLFQIVFSTFLQEVLEHTC